MLPILQGVTSEQEFTSRTLFPLPDESLSLWVIVQKHSHESRVESSVCATCSLFSSKAKCLFPPKRKKEKNHLKNLKSLNTHSKK